MAELDLSTLARDLSILARRAGLLANALNKDIDPRAACKVAQKVFTAGFVDPCSGLIEPCEGICQ